MSSCLLHPNASLAKVLQIMKGASSRAANMALKRSGRLWETEYFDRLIRDEEHFHSVARYIEWNAVKPKLCSDPKHCLGAQHMQKTSVAF